MVCIQRWMVCVLGVAAVALAGCSSSGSGSSGSTTTSAQAPAPSDSVTAPTNYSTAAEAAAGACDKFRTFYSDFTTRPPREQVQHLMNSAADVQAAAFQAYQLDNEGPTYEKLQTDASDLLAYVSQPDFATQGNILGAPVQTMGDDCP